MNLRTLTDAELLRMARNDADPLFSTDLETELLRRLEDASAALRGYAPIVEYLEAFDLTKPKDVEACKDALEFASDGSLPQAKALLDVLAEFDIDDPATLKKALERNAKFDDLMDDLAAPLASLQALTTPE